MNLLSAPNTITIHSFSTDRVSKRVNFSASCNQTGCSVSISTTVEPAAGERAAEDAIEVQLEAFIEAVKARLTEL